MTTKRRSIPTVLIAGAAAIALAVLPAMPAAAAETWYFNGTFNCGSNQVLTSMQQKGAGQHVHTSTAGPSKSKSVSSPSSYTWSYFNSGYTAVSSAYITSSIDVSAGSRSCDY